MSIIKLKDLDFYLTNFLDDASLLNLNRTNKYYYGLYDDVFYNKRYYKKYGHLQITQPVNRSEYFINRSYFLEQKHIDGIEYAVKKDDRDLLYLIGHFLPTFTIFGAYFTIEKTVESDAVNCFKYLYTDRIRNYKRLINCKSDKIVSYLYRENQLEYTTDLVYFALVEEYDHYIELYLKDRKFDMELIEEVIYKITFSQDEVSFWLKNYNKAFSLFIKSLSWEQINEIRLLALQRDRHFIIKLVTIYTSPFSEFYR